MDADGDERVTAAEYVALFQGKYTSRDTDGDGVLCAKEFPLPAFKSANTNQDAVLSSGEYEALYRRQFERRDANGNGSLTIDEM